MTAAIADLIREATVVRICHDLASPSGALANGVELLGMALGDENFQNEAIGLLKNSTVSLSARLEFYRAAFGNASAKGLTAAGAKAVAEKYTAQLGDSARVFRLAEFPNAMPELSAEAESSSAEWWRFALLMVLIAAESMPFGGDISVFVERDMPTLRCEGKLAILPDQFFQDFAGLEQIDPRTLGSVLLRYHAGLVGLAVTAESGDSTFDVRLVNNDL